MNKEVELCKICDLEKNLSDEKRQQISITLQKIYASNSTILQINHMEILLKYEWKTQVLGIRGFPLHRVEELNKDGFVIQIINNSNFLNGSCLSD
jgi:hypothetical protein